MNGLDNEIKEVNLFQNRKCLNLNFTSCKNCKKKNTPYKCLNRQLHSKKKK